MTRILGAMFNTVSNFRDLIKA